MKLGRILVADQIVRLKPRLTGGLISVRDDGVVRRRSEGDGIGTFGGPGRLEHDGHGIRKGDAHVVVPLVGLGSSSSSNEPESEDPSRGQEGNSSNGSSSDGADVLDSRRGRRGGVRLQFLAWLRLRALEYARFLRKTDDRPSDVRVGLPRVDECGVNTAYEGASKDCWRMRRDDVSASRSSRSSGR
jgi:hypothetical protein